MFSTIIVLLDSSGSMDVMGREPIISVNRFVADNRQKSPNANFVFYTFNSDITLEYSGPIQQAPEFHKFRPSGLTRLFDCIGQAVDNQIRQPIHRHVCLVIVTDGLDTISRTYNPDHIRQKLEMVQKDYQWSVFYLSASADYFAQAQNISIPSVNYRLFSQYNEGDLINEMASLSID